MLRATIIFLLLLPSAVFSKAPDTSNTISGIVWQEDAKNDGVRSSSERKLAGILVKLLDVNTEEVVATALTDAEGKYTLRAGAGNFVIEYVYPSDGFTPAAKRVGGDDEVNSAADATNFSDPFSILNNEVIDRFGLGLIPRDDTSTFCTSKPLTVTEWSESLLLPKSTIAAVPVSVRIFANEAVFHPSIGIENTGTANGYSVTAAGKVTLTLPAGSAMTMLSDVNITGNLGGFDGLKDYQGASGISLFNRSSFASALRNYTLASTITSKFVGADKESFEIPTLSQSSVSIVGSGNIETLIQTNVSVGVCVVYTYAQGALPVELVSFDSKIVEGAARLAWKTTSEVNSQTFQVQKSADAHRWETIATLESKGSENSVTDYNFIDAAPFNGKNFYRLKMTDRDGKFAFSRIVSSTFESDIQLVAYPNPSADVIKVAAVGQRVSQLTLLDKNGKALTAVASDVIDVRNLPGGDYLLKVDYSSGNTGMRRVVIVKR